MSVFKYNTDVKDSVVVLAIVEETCHSRFLQTIQHLGPHVVYATEYGFKAAAQHLANDTNDFTNKKVIIVCDSLSLDSDIQKVESVLGQVDDIIVI